MDHDKVALHVQNLLKWRDNINALLTGGGSAPGSSSEVLDGRIGELTSTVEAQGTHIAEIGEHVAAMQVALDNKAAPDDAELRNQDRLTAMLDWFESNKDGLEVLLALGDAPGSAGSAAGASDAQDSTDAALAAERAQADGASPAGT